MKKILLLSLVIISILIYKETKANEVVIPDSAIRLRVIPNSNSALDQNIKDKVKKYLENNTYQLLADETNIEDTRKKISEDIPNIKNNIEKIFNDNNYNMTYDVNFGYNYFPEKEYRKIKYKEGYYESLVITIGEGKGDNWWCVLFPNLCLVDLQENSDIEYRSLIVDAINKIF